MEGSSRIPGYYPETPAPVSRYNPVNGTNANNSPNTSLGSIVRAGGPIRRTPASNINRARAHSTPYARPVPQNTPGSGGRGTRRDDDDDEVRFKKGLGEKTAELVGSLISGVKDWFSSSKSPRREMMQHMIPRKKTPQRSLTSRMEDGFDDGEQQIQSRESDNMLSPSLAPHYAGHTPYHFSYDNIDGRWIVKQRSNKGLLAPEPPIFPLPNTNPGHRRQESQSKYATLPAKRSDALVAVSQNKRPRYQPSNSSLRPPKKWKLSRDGLAEQDEETIKWCETYGIDIPSLAIGAQKRPPFSSFSDIQRFDALRNDADFFERQGVRYVPRHTRKSSSLRHTTSSYELSRIAQENSAIYNASSIEPGDLSSSKLHAWRELVRLKEARQKAERENAQLERSKARNGYSPNTLNGSRVGSRGSVPVRGVAGEISDDVWILPSVSVRPGSAGSTNRSMRKRTSSPSAVEGGSWRSFGGGSRQKRPRGRDAFGTPEVQEVDEPMFDEGVQAGPPLLHVPSASHEPMVDEGVQAGPPLLHVPSASHSQAGSVNGMEGTTRRKRPGYFSAREEDLEPLEMDVEEFVTPARKKQRLSNLTHQGPKFAALWEPSRRENWPLGDGADKMDDVERTSVEDKELERVKNELKDLESPAFKLPPSARKEKESTAMQEEQPSPTKANNDNGGFTFQFSRPPPSAGPLSSAAKPETTAKPSVVEEVEEPKRNESPSKTSTFMQSILSEGKEFHDEQNMEYIPSVQKPKEEDAQVTEISQSETETQSTAPAFHFSLPPSQSSFGGASESSFGASQKSPPVETIEPKPINGGFNFGGNSASNGFSGFGNAPKTTSSGFSFNPTAPAVDEPQKNVSSPSEPSKPNDTLKFSFEAKPATSEVKEAEKAEQVVEKVEPKPATPIFTFVKSNDTETKKDSTAAPVFGSASGGFGAFGSAFGRSDDGKAKPLFGAPAPETTDTKTDAPLTNGATQESAPSVPAPVFGSGISSGFSFGNTEAPKREATPPPEAPASAVPQELDDSMDITDSPPASRSVPASVAPSTFSFNLPSPAPTSAPNAPTEAPKAPLFAFGASTGGQVNGTLEKPAIPTFGFSAAPPTEEKKPAFGSALPGTTSIFGANSPAPTTTFGGFGSAFPKKDETTQPKPMETPFAFQMNPNPVSFGGMTASKPVESQPSLFGGQPAAPAFGTTAPSAFGNTSGFSTNGVTSPPISITSPAASTGFNFNFNAQPAAANPAPAFGNATSFAFGAPNQTGAVYNPFASQNQPAVTSSSAFPGISSAPVSPQNQLSTFPGAQPQFGAAAPVNNPFAAASPIPTTNFTFGQNLPASPIFTLGSNQMQRSSSDVRPNNASPTRRFAQPGKKRFNRR